MKTFIHNFKYTFKILLRDKNQILWSVVFIIALGTLFFSVFGNIYDNSEMFKSIKVAAVIEDEQVKDSFENIILDISLDEESGEKLLDLTSVSDMEEANKLLTDGKLTGVFYSEDGELKLMVYGDGVKESVLSSLVEQYHQIVIIATELYVNAPEQAADAINTLITSESANVEKKTTDGNMDVYLVYFYNLIAMACLMSVLAGMRFTINSQANLSTIGARKSVSGSTSFPQTSSGLLATMLVQTICSLVGLLYLMLIGVDFGKQIGYICLAIFVGCITGTCLGFFVGSLGKLPRGAKEGLGTAITVGTSFLSGLMVANMRMTVEESCPIINKINPAALISDSFYSLQIYDTYDRYTKNLITLLIIAVVFLIAGVLAGRRKTYASI